MLHTAAKAGFCGASATSRAGSLRLAPTRGSTPQQRLRRVVQATEPYKAPKDPHQVAHKDVENAARQQRNSDVFDRIGGKEAMVAAVDLFYDKVWMPSAGGLEWHVLMYPISWCCQCGQTEMAALPPSVHVDAAVASHAPGAIPWDTRPHEAEPNEHMSPMGTHCILYIRC